MAINEKAWKERRVPRIPFQASISYLTPEIMAKGLVTDVSREGLRIESQDPVHIGMRLALVLYLSHDQDPVMVEAAINRPYEEVLKDRVYRPLKLMHTSLPNDSDLPQPYVRGYAVQDNPPIDVSKFFAAGWAWASGGIVSTPTDATRFVRGYVGGALIDQKTRAAQFQFRPGESDPPGPGVNSAGLALFRYESTCGTVYGHTGNTAGYTQFVGATADGRRSVVVSINAQITPKLSGERFAELRNIYELAVCAAVRRQDNNGNIQGENNGDIPNLPCSPGKPRWGSIR